MDTGFFYAIGAAVVWGFVYAVDQKILLGVSPITLIFVNAVISVLITLPWMILHQGSFKEVVASGKGNLALIVACAVLALFANFLIYTSIKTLDASTASIIEIAYPFFVVLFSYFLYQFTPNIYFFVGGTFLFIGSFIIIKWA